MRKIEVGLVLCALVAASGTAAAQERLPLLGEDGEATEEVLETLLAPGDFAARRFEYVSEGEEAQFAIDSSLGSAEPFAQLAPERLRWPTVAGLKIVVNDGSLKLRPAKKGVSDDDLDAGFAVRWILEVVGQRFTPDPRFEMRVAGAQVFSSADGTVLLEWNEEPPSKICSAPRGNAPSCDLPGVGKEVRAAAMSPDGMLLAVALGGLKPRVEMYGLAGEPSISWKAFFPTDSGGVTEVSFSSDGRWLVALTGSGRMHRFDAKTGGAHMAIPSEGRTARAIPPGRVMAVAGESGEVTLWYLSDGTIAWRLPPRKLRGPIDRLAASGDGQRIATLEYDEDRTVVRVWETNRRSMLAQIEVDAYSIADIALDGDGGRLFVTHGEKGLMVTKVDRNSSKPKEVTGSAAARCTGRLQWIPGEGALVCSVERGVMKIDTDGRPMGELSTGMAASDWIMASASEGDRSAAVGEGHILVWRDDEGSKE